MRLGLDHAVAFVHHFGQRYRFQRQRQLAGLDQGEIENPVDQIQQMPSRLGDLVYPASLDGRGRRGADLQQLGKAENGIERSAQIVAHFGKEFRFCAIGFFRRRFAALHPGIGHLDLFGQFVCFNGGDDQVRIRLLQRLHVVLGRSMQRLCGTNFLFAQGGRIFAQMHGILPCIRRFPAA
ncbi:hypothetical protein GALL_481300 [mine drainage metagenome]|uniref:Uncharacterized protein n=1 Tax=mine drainage metagenome TaxID=410659 RepID=A0A1J5PYB7_9ZZZZ